VQVLEGRDREQRVELARDREAGQVEVQPAEVMEHIDRRVDTQEKRERGDAVGDHRQRRARVRNDELDVGMPRDRTVEHEVHHRAGRVEHELEHRPGPPERGVLPTRRRSRVEKDAGPAPVELVEDRLPRRVAEVGASDIGEQHVSVDVQVVVAVCDLGDRAVDIG
jgi:hypothetical protein